MQNVRTTKASKAQVSLQYPHRLNFYDVPPRYDITLDDFERCALDRLHVLAEIESSIVRNRTPEEMQSVTIAQCKKYLPLHSTTAFAVNLEDERSRDHVSHFVLRLAFCRSDELRRRFVKAESALFRVRYDTDDPTEREAFLNSRDFGWQQVSTEEKEWYVKQLQAALPPSRVPMYANEMEFRKVHWTRVPDLVEKRRVFVKAGYAYVPAHEQSSIVFQEFETRLEKALELAARALPQLDEDTRILPILSHVSRGFMSGIPSDYSTSIGTINGEEVQASMIDGLAKRHFPLCMRNMHDHLRKERHLKYQGRLQYGLFLKVLGLSIEESLIFWRGGFRNLTEDEFNKKYKYNVRHSYGLEGKRVNYPAKSCQRIITQDQPGPQDCHGCPYKTFSPDNLQAALLSVYKQQGLSMNELPEILNSAKSGHYQIACTRVFEVTHKLKKGEGVGDGESVDHPNRYATRSRELTQPKTEDGEKMDTS